MHKLSWSYALTGFFLPFFFRMTDVWFTLRCRSIRSHGLFVETLAISYCNPAATRLRPRWKDVVMICLDFQQTEGWKPGKYTGEFKPRNVQAPFVSRAKAGVCFYYETDKIAFPTGSFSLNFSASSSGTSADLLSLTETQRIRPHAPYTCHTGKEGHLFISQNSSITP